MTVRPSKPPVPCDDPDEVLHHARANAKRGHTLLELGQVDDADALLLAALQQIRIAVGMREAVPSTPNATEVNG